MGDAVTVVTPLSVLGRVMVRRVTCVGLTQVQA
ncbi:hypothetical protein JNB_15863 [Janibacter sp. HTCC2649]|nr:hypothetical protein JNB_15863 [Janibacter sp. HTCC2649]